MKTIHKYQFLISPMVTLKMPRGAEILTIDMQNNTPTIWAIVDPEMPVETKVLGIYRTGHPGDVPDISRHLATIQQDDFVWHIFE